jgi:hypothetical protein
MSDAEDAADVDIMFKLQLDPDQVKTLIAYSVWKGFGSNRCGEAIRAMIDGAGQFMSKKGVKLSDFQVELDEWAAKHLPRAAARKQSS